MRFADECVFVFDARALGGSCVRGREGGEAGFEIGLGVGVGEGGGGREGGGGVVVKVEEEEEVEVKEREGRGKLSAQISSKQKSLHTKIFKYKYLHQIFLFPLTPAYLRLRAHRLDGRIRHRTHFAHFSLLFVHALLGAGLGGRETGAV
jgi:hypothetical protein